MPDAAAALARAPLFDEVPERERSSLAKGMRERSYEDGAPVLEEGEGGIAFFVIAEGEARVDVRGETVRTLRAGDAFGEMALIDPDSDTRSATVTASGPLVVLGLSAWQFRPFLRDHPEVAWGLLQTLVRRLREAEARGR